MPACLPASLGQGDKLVISSFYQQLLRIVKARKAVELIKAEIFSLSYVEKTFENRTVVFFLCCT